MEKNQSPSLPIDFELAMKIIVNADKNEVEKKFNKPTSKKGKAYKDIQEPKEGKQKRKE